MSLLLVSDTKSEINRRVLALPVTEHVEIPLPSAHGARPLRHAVCAGVRSRWRGAAV